MTRYRETVFKFTGGRCSKEDEAKELLARVQGHVFVVTKIDRKQQRTQPPQLYDLTELQRDMNRRFGLSAADTLKVAQSLYERKLITYPRTDSRHLSKTVAEGLPDPYEPLEGRFPRYEDAFLRAIDRALALVPAPNDRHSGARDKAEDIGARRVITIT
mgnify:CR=1 FL=1